MKANVTFPIPVVKMLFPIVPVYAVGWMWNDKSDQKLNDGGKREHHGEEVGRDSQTLVHGRQRIPTLYRGVVECVFQG